MESIDLFLLFTRPLDQAEIPYMATGSVAAMLYGIPRFTHDLDLILDLRNIPVEDFERLYPARDFYCPPAEVIYLETRRSHRGHFNLIHHDSGLKADIYLFGKDELHQWGLERRRRIDLEDGQGLWLSPPEYVILRKLQYYREGHSQKHLQDIRGMFEVSPDLMDLDILKKFVAEKRLETEWEALGLS
jgi:hypothetical protein